MAKRGTTAWHERQASRLKKAMQRVKHMSTFDIESRPVHHGTDIKGNPYIIVETNPYPGAQKRLFDEKWPSVAEHAFDLSRATKAMESFTTYVKDHHIAELDRKPFFDYSWIEQAIMDRAKIETVMGGDIRYDMGSTKTGRWGAERYAGKAVDFIIHDEVVRVENPPDHVVTIGGERFIIDYKTTQKADKYVK